MGAEPGLERLLRAPGAAEIRSLEAWWQGHRALAAARADRVELALEGGFRADRLAWAFASGYQAALLRMLGGEAADRRLALCATEAGGAHPKHIRTALRQEGGSWRLSGEKSFVTLGTFAERLLVIADLGEEIGGRKELRAVWVDADGEGVRVEALPELPMVPEIPHALVRLDSAPVPEHAILPGDAWSTLVKPFRTVEDIHVHAALTGYSLRLAALGGWPERVGERLLARAFTLRALGQGPADGVETHLVLAGVLADSEQLLGELEPLIEALPGPTAALWRRDRGLLRVAGSAREARRQAARAGLR